LMRLLILIAIPLTKLQEVIIILNAGHPTIFVEVMISHQVVRQLAKVISYVNAYPRAVLRFSLLRIHTRPMVKTLVAITVQL